MEITNTLRDVLEDIDNHPGIVMTGPTLGLANKLRKRGLVETFLRSDDRHDGEVRGLRTTDAGRSLLGRGLADATRAKVEMEIRAILHAHRDCLRNRGQDTTKATFDANDGYYGEAVGVMRGLRLLGLGDFGAINKAGNLLSWLSDLERSVLTEENYGGSNECDHCLAKYGKDGAGRKR